ncbi:SRPBCC domain-containing protein [Psychroflexus sediminis]|uniref:Polyketide cyclase / dehydrase and lipid transport n=1 Tax=Psychroflexus sediminis TaxID=470826 RepID=A0A1G7Z6G3_9FLAO|nr:SRPBCC domain-containing protein [Psychroflexus sediminis]SDH04342.1 hypothetical protein SAMN04488027_11916 [Psychroflexus sediminis]
MKKIETQVVIESDISTVWNLLTDFEKHPDWNPFITSIQGEKAAGKFLSVSIKPPEGKGMTFKPVVLKFEPNKEFRWKGKLGIQGIFDGEHYFILEEVDNNQTKFIHGEKFSGILVYLMGNVLEKTKIGFELMNEALKKQSESLKTASVT